MCYGEVVVSFESYLHPIHLPPNLPTGPEFVTAGMGCGSAIFYAPGGCRGKRKVLKVMN